MSLMGSDIISSVALFRLPLGDNGATDFKSSSRSLLVFNCTSGEANNCKQESFAQTFTRPVIHFRELTV